MTNEESRIILCTGGARSGKSEFAERLVLSLPGRKDTLPPVRFLTMKWKIV